MQLLCPQGNLHYPSVLGTERASRTGHSSFKPEKLNQDKLVIIPSQPLSQQRLSHNSVTKALMPDTVVKCCEHCMWLHLLIFPLTAYVFHYSLSLSSLVIALIFIFCYVVSINYYLIVILIFYLTILKFLNSLESLSLPGHITPF